MILPRDEFAGRVDAALEIVIAECAIVVVMKIVFASPQKFDRRADFLGDRGGFKHVIVGETAAESTAGAAKMNRDIGFGNFQDVGNHLTAASGSLAWRPDFEIAVFVMSETVLRFHRRVSEKRIEIGSVDGFRGGF